jgi:beta-1,4-N-acetylglucosaminyltransferase
MILLLLTCCVITLVAILRVVFVVHQINTRRNSLERPVRSTAPIKTLVVLGSGGHTTEMLQLLSNLDPNRYKPLIYVVADTDDTSERRFKAFGGRQPDVVCIIPRSREVGQSYLTSIGSTLYSFLFCFKLIFEVRPNLLLCNGPGTCLPVAICTFFYRIVGLCEGNMVFVESFCRVER